MSKFIDVLSEKFSAFGVSDAFDILFLASFLFITYRFVRRRRAFPILVGVLVFVALERGSAALGYTGKGEGQFSLSKIQGDLNMSCFCNLFENSTVWLIIIALILLFFFCGNEGCGNYGCDCGRNGCGNYNNNNGCGCGC